MGIVDYLSQEQTGEPWPESILDEKFVVTSIECFHMALDCLYSRLSDTNSPNQNEKFLEHSQQQKVTSEVTKYRHGCYSNLKFQKRTKLDRNKNGFGSQFSTVNNALKRNTLVNLTNTIKLVNLIQKVNFNTKAMESGKLKIKIVRIEDCKTQEDNDKITEEEVTETTFHRTCRIRRGALDRSGSNSIDKHNYAARAVTWNQDAIETKNLLSIWDLVSQENDYTGNIRELEAATQMLTSSLSSKNCSNSPVKSIIEVDLTAKDDDGSQEVSVVQPTRWINKNRNKLDESLEDLVNIGTFSLSKLFDKTLLAKLISEDVWMDRLRRKIEKRLSRIRFNGPVYEPIVELFVHLRRLHPGLQSPSSSGTTPTGGHEET